MIRPVLKAGLYSLIVVFCLSARADNYEEASAWLERMATAMDQMDFQGTFVFMHGNDVQTLRITHMVGKNGVRERMYSLNGPNREIIRDASGVRCVLGKDRAYMESAMGTPAIFPEIPLTALDEASSQYHFKIGSVSRVAGHQGRQIDIVPKDEYRYGYDLWLEIHSGLLLKWALYDANRQVLARLMFTNLRLGPDVDASELDSPTPDSKFVQLQPMVPGTPVRGKPKSKWQPQGLPPGFTLTARSYDKASQQSGFEHLVYSDGLASVSVYIEKPDQASAQMTGLNRIGTANAFSLQASDRQITAIGEVPEITVRTIGDAFANELGNH